MSNKNLLKLIIFIAIVARFVALDYAPPHLSNDEIGAAYAAYSISKTSKDASGEFLPVLWKSHGGYGSPLAVYIPMISIIIMGNSDFAVRLPSAILGSLTIILLGFLVKELTKNSNLALTSSFLLAISPWHFSASRWALESNYALFFVVLGIFLFFFGINRNRFWLVVLSFISFAFSIYSYYTEWILTPLIILALLFRYNRFFLERKARSFLVFLFFLILLVPICLSFVRTFNSSRAVSELITKDVAVSRLLVEEKNSLGKLQVVLRAIFDKYSSYLSLDYLFFYGADILPKENPYQFGFFLFPFFIPFIYGLFRLKTFYSRNSDLVYLLLFISPLIASFTEGSLNNWRSLPELLPVALISGVGVLSIWSVVKEKLFIKVFVFVLLLINFFYFFLIYFRHFPLQKAVNYQYGFKQIALFINGHYNEYEKIVIDRRFGDKNYYYIGVPSSYIPFYTSLDPHKVQNAKFLTNGIAFDKYEFRDINWESEKIRNGYLYVLPYDIVPDPKYGLNLVYEIRLPNWQPAFRLYVKED